MFTKELTLRGTPKELSLAVDNLKKIENVIKVGTPFRRGKEKDYVLVVEIEYKEENNFKDFYADGE